MDIYDNYFIITDANRTMKPMNQEKNPLLYMHLRVEGCQTFQVIPTYKGKVNMSGGTCLLNKVERERGLRRLCLISGLFQQIQFELLVPLYASCLIRIELRSAVEFSRINSASFERTISGF